MFQGQEESDLIIDIFLLRPLAGAKYCNQFVHNVLNLCEFALTITSRRQVARSPPNLHTMVSRQVCIQRVLNVKVKGQRSRDTGTFVQLYWHENRFLRIIGIRGIIHYSRQVCNLLFLAFQYSSPGGSTIAGEVCYLRLPFVDFIYLKYFYTVRWIKLYRPHRPLLAYDKCFYSGVQNAAVRWRLEIIATPVCEAEVNAVRTLANSIMTIQN